MKNVNLKTSEVLNAFNVLNAANYKQLDDADKIKLWKIARVMKPIAKQFEDDTRDASEKFKPDGIDGQLEKAREYEAKLKAGNTDKLPMTQEEYEAFIHGPWAKFSQLVNKAVKDFGEKDVEMEFEPLTEEAFGKLMASNDWTIERVMTLGDLITE